MTTTTMESQSFTAPPSAVVAKSLHEYHLRLRESLWQASLVAAEDMRNELRAVRDEFAREMAALRESHAREAHGVLAELKGALAETASQVEKDARLVTDLAMKMQMMSDDVSKEAVEVRKVSQRMKDVQRALKEFPLQVSAEVDEQVRGAFEKQERGLMNEIAQKLRHYELVQVETMGNMASDMTTATTKVVEVMTRDEMRRVATCTLPRCIAAEVTRQLRERSCE